MKDKMSSLYIMPNKIKTIINSTWWMLFLAIIASLLHPLLYSARIGFYLDCPSYFFLHILAYTILGNLIWNALKHKAWWIPALAICYKKQKGQLSKLSEIKERTSSLQPPSIIAIISISYLPFPVLVIAAARGMQKILEGELLFESFSLHSICRQQIDARLFFGKEENL